MSPIRVSCTSVRCGPDFAYAATELPAPLARAPRSNLYGSTSRPAPSRFRRRLTRRFSFRTSPSDQYSNDLLRINLRVRVRVRERPAGARHASSSLHHRSYALRHARSVRTSELGCFERLYLCCACSYSSAETVYRRCGNVRE